MLFFWTVYKKNHYCILLCIIIGVIGLNINFYIGFAFVSFKTYIDYYWILSYFQEFYIEGNILNPIFAKGHCEKTLIQALEIIFP